MAQKTPSISVALRTRFAAACVFFGGVILCVCTLAAYPSEYSDFFLDPLFSADFVSSGPIAPDSLRLVFADTGTTARDTLASYPGALFAVNGPYFQTFSDASYSPAGLLVRDGASLGRIDAADPNLSVVFRISSGSVASISPLADTPARDLMDARIAFQAGPLLVRSGAIVVTDTSSWHAAGAYPRTALGIDADGEIRIFASAKPCSLREFAARILQSVPAIREVVNLDGGPSTAYAWPNDHSFRAHRKLPFFIVGGAAPSGQ